MGVMQPPTQQYNHKSTAERVDAPRHAVDSTTSMFIPPVSSAEQGPLRRDGPARSGRKGKVVSIGYMAQWRYRLFLDRLIVRDGANSTVRPPYGVILDMREACGCGWVKGAALSTAILCCQGRCGKADLAAGMNVGLRGKRASQALTHRLVQGWAVRCSRCERRSTSPCGCIW